MRAAGAEARRQLRAIRTDLDKLRRFVDGMEENLRVARADAGQPNPAEDDLWDLDQALPWLYRGSALLTILGFLEHNLNAVCETLGQENGCATRITDLPGKGLRRSRHYLRKHIGIDFPSGSKTWTYLLKVADIRNLIAHRDSLVKDDNPELVRFIETDPNLSIDAGGRVRLHAQALSEFIDRMDDFFMKLEQSIPGSTS